MEFKEELQSDLYFSFHKNKNARRKHSFTGPELTAGIKISVVLSVLAGSKLPARTQKMINTEVSLFRLFPVNKTLGNTRLIKSSSE